MNFLNCEKFDHGNFIKKLVLRTECLTISPFSNQPADKEILIELSIRPGINKSSI